MHLCITGLGTMLPGDVQDRIRDIHRESAAAAIKQLHQGAFGRIGERLDGKLQSAIDRNLQDTLNKNEILSSRACDSLESTVRPSATPVSRSL